MTLQTPKAPKKQASEVFSKTFHNSKSMLTQTAQLLGLAHYEPFAEGQIYDDLIVGLEPYGIYTFTDNSQAHVVGMNGGYYIYVSKSPEFKNHKPQNSKQALGFRPIPSARTYPKQPPTSFQVSPEFRDLAKRALETLRQE